jgi:hypothetical protein
MTRSSLNVTPLEDRSTPVSFSFKTTLTVAVTTPPQDPMDNPPPAQPGTGTTGTNTGSTTPISPPPPPPTTSTI